MMKLQPLQADNSAGREQVDSLTDADP